MPEWVGLLGYPRGIVVGLEALAYRQWLKRRRGAGAAEADEGNEVEEASAVPTTMRPMEIEINLKHLFNKKLCINNIMYLLIIFGYSLVKFQI